jgi:chorismate dehydratase
MDDRVRIGAVSYLNSKPLVYELEHLAPQARIEYDVPSRLARRLEDGELDVALIPSIEYLRRPEYSIVTDACIVCRGPVLSVRLFFRVPPPQVRTLALDEGSRSSAAMARILLRQRFGLHPQLEQFSLGSSLADAQTDAILLIGDRGILERDETFVEVWDLGDQWCRWAELPFVFAMWTARAGCDLRGVETALLAAREAGVAHLPEIAQREAAHVGLDVAACLHYLQENLHFRFGPQEQRGLELFYRHAVQMGLASGQWNLTFHDCGTAR